MARTPLADGLTDAVAAVAEASRRGVEVEQVVEEHRTTLTGGVKWAGQIGGMVPEIDLGYRYQFGDKRSAFTARPRSVMSSPMLAVPICAPSGERRSVLFQRTSRRSPDRVTISFS